MHSTDRLARHLTTWKAWYAIPASLTLLVTSLIPAIAGGFLDSDAPSTKTVMAILIPVQFIAFAALALAFIALFEKNWPSTGDLGLTAGMPRRTVVILAPVCEELLYRGAILRPIHDALIRRGRSALVASTIAIALSALAFALPHLGDSLTGRQAIAYMITGCVFGVVYVLTGSITAAMVSHALPSWVTYARILYFGHGDSTVHPLLWILVLGCPVWVYLVARLLRAVFPDRTATGAAFGTAAGTSGDRTT